ncbi:hypothetical protein HMPREF9616_00063 [Cutibacterium acnes HL007PA1]|nr:hypothetical protein HMPREF9616_00063 [Cutibacterium acnes HL007PA1]
MKYLQLWSVGLTLPSSARLWQIRERMASRSLRWLQSSPPKTTRRIRAAWPGTACCNAAVP